MLRPPSLRTTLRTWLPPALDPLARSLFGPVRFTGDYTSWEEAARECPGYSSEAILERVKQSALAVKRGEAAYEQDSVLVQTRSYAWPVVASLLWIALGTERNLHVLDFGGSLASNYFRHRPFLEPRLRSLQWSVVEQPHFVKCGQDHLQDESLRFFSDIASCVAWSRPDVVLLSGVLQYLPRPYEFLSQLSGYGIDHLLFDRTSFALGDRERLCLQHVSERIYPATYPAWFFSQSRFLNALTPAYSLLEQFEGEDRANIPSTYQGFFFSKRGREAAR
jgi:putative methyltransferase (TIGR04325 family)